ncbi:MAG: hypothetical protein ACTTH7_08660 [Treponema sp.]
MASFYYLPFYWLSITTNLVMGVVLSFFNDEETSYTDRYPFLQDMTFLLILVIFSGTAAVFKLLTPVGGQLPIIGDLAPAVSGSAGTLIFFNRWWVIAHPEKLLPAFFEKLTGLRKIIGYSCLAAAILHLFFSPVLFL